MPAITQLRRLLRATLDRTDVATWHRSAACLPSVSIDPVPTRQLSDRTSLTLRHWLPVTLVRMLGADCPACRGIGCPECAHTGLQ